MDFCTPFYCHSVHPINGPRSTLQKKRILLTSGPGQVKVKKKKQPETKEYQYSRLARTLCPAPSFWTWPPSKILKVQPGQNDKFMTLSCFDPFPNLYLEKCGVEQKAE